MKYDLAIIGAGPGGYTAAIRASKHGMKVIIFEKDQIGGVCLNYGCIPTKSLLHSSEIIYESKSFIDHGIEINNTGYNLDKIVGRSKETIKILSEDLRSVLCGNINIVNKEVTNISPSKDATNHIVYCNNDKYEAKYIIISTGARHRDIGIKGWSYKEAINPKIVPKKLAIIGSGAIGMEFACFYSSLGSEVVIFERENRILPQEDMDISESAEKIFSKRMKFVKSAEVSEESLQQFDQTLIAAGVIPNFFHIDGLEKNEYGGIKINEYCETNIKNIYAIGDVTHPPYIAHKAMKEAENSIDHIVNKEICKNVYIPMCIYTYPQIASIGKRIQDLQENNVKITKYNFSSNGSAVLKGKGEGFVKVIYDPLTLEILGVHMIGHLVTEMIHSISIAMSAELTVKEMQDIIFPHPTMSETILESFKRVRPTGFEPTTS